MAKRRGSWLDVSLLDTLLAGAVIVGAIVAPLLVGWRFRKAIGEVGAPPPPVDEGEEEEF